MTCISIVGWGRFGAALAGLCHERGFEVRAWDPAPRQASALQVGSLRELLARPGLVVLAVPMQALDSTLSDLSPQLNGSHWVMDVASVKVRSQESLLRHLGQRIPWAACHPLFGPVSLARGEGPLKVVLCPSGLHPVCEEQASRFWERLGCEVLVQEAHAHDRDMASTHALGFFLAKGLLDAGAGEGVAHPPPSFQAMLRSVALVRSDAGHLFRALHLENPYARAARRRLLAALQAVDRALEEEASGGVPHAALDIPGGPSPAEDLIEVRDLIDSVDRELVSLLERRSRLALRAARAKSGLGRGVLDADREARMLEARRAWATSRNLDPEGVEALFQAILHHSRALQGQVTS